MANAMARYEWMKNRLIEIDRSQSPEKHAAYCSWLQSAAGIPSLNVDSGRAVQFKSLFDSSPYTRTSNVCEKTALQVGISYHDPQETHGMDREEEGWARGTMYGRCATMTPVDSCISSVMAMLQMTDPGANWLAVESVQVVCTAYEKSGGGVLASAAATQYKDALKNYVDRARAGCAPQARLYTVKAQLELVDKQLLPEIITMRGTLGCNAQSAALDLPKNSDQREATLSDKFATPATTSSSAENSGPSSAGRVL